MSWLRSPSDSRYIIVLSLVATLGVVAAGMVFLYSRNVVRPSGAEPSGDAKSDPAALPAPILGPEAPPDPWDTPGAHWRLRVKQYNSPGVTSHYESPTVQLEMNVDVLVLPPRHLGDRKIVRLQFTPNAPENREQMPSFGTIKDEKWVLELDRAGGQVEGVRTQDPDLRRFAYPPMPFQGVKNLRTTLYGFPVNWMTQATDVAVVPPVRKERRFSDPHYEGIESFEPSRVAAGLDGRGKEIEAVKVTYEERGWDTVTYKLEQTWVPGEPWWRGYKQWNNVGITLEAVRVEDK